MGVWARGCLLHWRGSVKRSPGVGKKAKKHLQNHHSKATHGAADERINQEPIENTASHLGYKKE